MPARRAGGLFVLFDVWFSARAHLILNLRRGSVNGMTFYILLFDCRRQAAHAFILELHLETFAAVRALIMYPTSCIMILRGQNEYVFFAGITVYNKGYHLRIFEYVHLVIASYRWLVRRAI